MRELWSSRTARLSGIILSLLLKIGIPPFHWWFLSLMEKLERESLFILSTLQKIIPIYLLFKVARKFVALILFLRAAVSIQGIFNQVRVKKLIGYSSILGVTWVLSCLPKLNLGILYLIVYSLGLFIWIWSSEIVSLLNLKSLSRINSRPQWRGALRVGLISMAGFPPFLGFYLKVLVLRGLLLGFHWEVLSVILIVTPLGLSAYSRALLLVIKIKPLGFEGSAQRESKATLVILTLILRVSGLLILLHFSSICVSIWHLRTNLILEMYSTP